MMERLAKQQDEMKATLKIGELSGRLSKAEECLKQKTGCLNEKTGCLMIC